MADPLGGDVFDVENLAEAEIEKLLKQVCNKCYVSAFEFSFKIQFRKFMTLFPSRYISVSRNWGGTIKFYWSEGENIEEIQ